MPDFGLTDDGYTAPRQADYLTVIRDRYNQALLALGFTELPDYDRDTYLGETSEIMSFVLGQLAEANQAVYDARSPSNATGLQLSNLALIVGVTRQEATKSTTVLKCDGTDGTIILLGKIVQGGGDNDDARWIATEDKTIGDLVAGTVDVNFEAETAGETVATPGTIDTIVTPIDGWTAVTNVASASPGNDRETDGELRVRRQQALQGAGATSTNAILSALLDLSFVTGATVVDNKTDTLTVIDGLSLDPYSVGAVVAPSTITTAQKELVVAAIYSKLGAGTATSGTETGTVTKRDERSETINFFLATDTAVTIAYVLTMETGFVLADVDTALRESVADFFLTLTTGSTVNPMPLYALADDIDGIANVTSLLINGGAVAVPHDADELPVLTVPIGIT